MSEDFVRTPCHVARGVHCFPINMDNNMSAGMVKVNRG